MFEFLDGTELGTVYIVALRKDYGIELSKILGVKLGFKLGVVIGTMVGKSDSMHLSDG